MSFEYRALRSHPGVEIVTARNAPPTSEVHDAFSVMLVVAGLVAYRCNGREHVRDASVAMLVGPVDVRVDEESAERSDYRVLRVAPGALAEIALRLGLPSSNLVVVEHEIGSTGSLALFDAFFAALDRDAAPAQMQRLLDACVAEIVRRCTTSPVSAERREVRVAREHMHENVDPMTVDEIADVAGLGKWGFVALFRHQVGMAPHQYLVKARLARARAMLAKGVSCGEVALASGFSDQSHLNRWFRRAFGVTPRAYQRAVRT